MKSEYTIFYTDDDQEDLDYFREIVEIIGTEFKVVTQNTGKQLLHALNNPPPTPYIIFLDINIPGMNGLDILQYVRSLEMHKNLPVIMFSTSKDQAIIDKSRELGANYYLPKSGAFDKLKSSIEHALKMNWNTFTPNKANFVYNY